MLLVHEATLKSCLYCDAAALLSLLSLQLLFCYRFFRKIMPYFMRIGVHQLGIAPESLREITLAKEFPKSVVNERYIDSPIPGNICTYKDRTLIIIWSTHPMAIFINSKEVADNFKAYFEFLWKVAKP